MIDAAIEQNVFKKLKAWAKIVALKEVDPRLAQFGELLIEALHACIGAQIALQDSRFSRQRDLCEYLKEEVNDAELLIKGLRNFNNKYRFPPLLRFQDGSHRRFDLVSPAQDLEVLLSLIKPAAETCVDRGGAPPMLAFKALAEGLVRAYKHATGETGIGRSAREGRLLDLLDAVLPTAEKLAKSITGRPLRKPKDPGQYLHRAAERLRGS
jgi:hypothetical protein